MKARCLKICRQESLLHLYPYACLRQMLNNSWREADNTQLYLGYGVHVFPLWVRTAKITGITLQAEEKVGHFAWRSQLRESGGGFAEWLTLTSPRRGFRGSVSCTPPPPFVNAAIPSPNEVVADNFLESILIWLRLDWSSLELIPQKKMAYRHV